MKKNIFENTFERHVQLLKESLGGAIETPEIQKEMYGSLLRSENPEINDLLKLLDQFESRLNKTVDVSPSKSFFGKKFFGKRQDPVEKALELLRQATKDLENRLT